MPLLLFVLLVAAPVAARAGEITVLAPSTLEATLLSRNKTVNVVVKVAEAADLNQLLLRADSDDHVVEPMGRHPRNSVYYVHYRLPLKKGANNFTLAPGNRKLSIKFTPLSTLLNVNLDDPGVYRFHRQVAIPEECAGCHTEKLPPDAAVDMVRYGQFSPECFSCHSNMVNASEWRHFPSSALLCRTCHQSANDVKELSVPTGKVETLCFACHVNNKKWTSMSHIHGPVGTGDCTICHDPHGSGNEFQLWADGKGKLCVVCHEEMKRYLDPGQKSFVVHGIMNAKGCGACHSPHATNYRFQLFGEINDLCVSCHVSLAGLTQGHPVQNHPIKGKSDPRRAGNPFSCTSCHNPHGSPYKYLLIGDVRGGRICVKCHSEKKADQS
jgi:predicted CXXCH cytochrome family protein